MTIEPPKDLAAATRLLERIAKLDARIAGRHATRVALIAKINAAADKLLVPALAQRERLVELLKPWWSSDEAKAARGTAKSMVLGGCKIGTKESPASLTYGGKAEDFGLAQLRAEKWAKPLITVSYSVNKTAVREALKAKRSDELIAMGFGEKQDTVFFVTSVKLPTLGR
ncbi:host-nuclease inhibitor Gam family protein [Sphingomonas koreensis]|nr:host-nuclease inhibitor Gam family protein [Sphingomonas koreensis]MDC7809954.1 host-nuclease inhibitor Gam family protein [Sphingomonas koreensis]